MQRTQKLAILLLTGVVGLLTIAVVKLSGPGPGIVGLGLQRYTNACAVFTVTNRTAFQINYFLTVERRFANGWPIHQGGSPHIINPQTGVLRPREVSTLTVPVMTYAPAYPWRLSIFCYRPPLNPNSFRFRAGLWLLRLRMPNLAKKLFGECKVVQVSGPQMEQWER